MLSFIFSIPRASFSRSCSLSSSVRVFISSAKTEATTMLFMPVLIVLVMSFMGGGLMDKLFSTWVPGHLVATIALVIFVISFVLMVKSTDIKV